LGCGWSGLCSAGESHVCPTEEELSKHCNLGYARCVHLPKDRKADAVRFCVAAANESIIVVDFVCERDHLPGEHGRMEFDQSGSCAQPHSDHRIQRLAECFVASYLELKRNGASADGTVSSDPGLFDDSAPKS
jgi:hypothetical protein